MTASRGGEALRWHDALQSEGTVAGLGDERLMDRFLTRPGASGEAAFEAIVRRHGPMVLAACRSILRDAHEAEDAFQATFLVLARRAASVRDRDRLAAWLVRTARRIALRSRRDSARRAAFDRARAEEVGQSRAPADPADAEAAGLVRAEVDRLPESDRRLIRLTYWQGKTYEEVAALLSWPIGTVRSRLSRARQRLRNPLARLGLAPAPETADRAEPTPSDSLIRQTVRAATPFAGGLRAAIEVGAVPASVAALARGEIAMLSSIRWKSLAVLTLAGGAATAGFAQRAQEPADARPATPAPAAAPVEGKGPSLLINGGVEEGEGNSPRAWTRGRAVPGVELLWSRNVGHGAGSSLGLKKTADYYFPIAQWSQAVAWAGDAPRLKVSAWVKAEGVTKAILDAQFVDIDGGRTHAWVAYIGAKEPGDPAVSHDWKRYEGVVAIPPGTKKILVAPQIYGPGAVWFDDLAAEPTTDPAIDPTAP